MPLGVSSVAARVEQEHGPLIWTEERPGRIRDFSRAEGLPVGLEQRLVERQALLGAGQLLVGQPQVADQALGVVAHHLIEDPPHAPVQLGVAHLVAEPLVARARLQHRQAGLLLVDGALDQQPVGRGAVLDRDAVQTADQRGVEQPQTVLLLRRERRPVGPDTGDPGRVERLAELVDLPDFFPQPRQHRVVGVDRQVVVGQHRPDLRVPGQEVLEPVGGQAVQHRPHLLSGGVTGDLPRQRRLGVGVDQPVVLEHLPGLRRHQRAGEVRRGAGGHQVPQRCLHPDQGGLAVPVGLLQRRERVLRAVDQRSLLVEERSLVDDARCSPGAGRSGRVGPQRVPVGLKAPQRRAVGAQVRRQAAEGLGRGMQVLPQRGEHAPGGAAGLGGPVGDLTLPPKGLRRRPHCGPQRDRLGADQLGHPRQGPAGPGDRLAGAAQSTRGCRAPSSPPPGRLRDVVGQGPQPLGEHGELASRIGEPLSPQRLQRDQQ